MKPELLTVILFALAFACATTAWVALRKFRRQRKSGDSRVLGVIAGALMAILFAFAGIWLLLASR